MFPERLKLHFAMNIYVIHNFSLPGTWVPQLWQKLALFSANLVPQRWQSCPILDTAQSQAKLPSFLRVNYSTKIILYGATQISTEPLKFLRSHSYFYGVSYISTESVIFLWSHSYFYGVTHIYTESLIFLRSHSYFYGASYISMEHTYFNEAT
jgi:hypothetical protein